MSRLAVDIGGTFTDLLYYDDVKRGNCAPPSI